MINLVNMLKESLELAKNNISVVVPSVIASFVMLALIKFFIGEIDETVGTLSSGVHEPRSLQTLFPLSFISLILHTFGQGMIISMVEDLIKGKWLLKI